MSASRRLARPMLAAIFINGGWSTLRDPSRVSKAAERVGVPIAEKVPGLPSEPEMLVRINGAVQLGAGVLLTAGKLPRLSSVALLASIVPTTLGGHRFWEEEDDTIRAAHRINFLKNVGLAGGLILSALDTGGAPSLGWRARRKVRRASGAATAARAAGLAAAASAASRGKGRVADAVPAGKATGAAAALHQGSDLASAALRGGRSQAATVGGRQASKAATAAKVGGRQASKAATAATVGGRQASKVAAKAAAKAAATGGSQARRVAQLAGDALPVG